MLLRATALFTCLLMASTAFAQTIYKYRHADGRISYSSRLIAGAELVETLNYRFDAPAATASPAPTDPMAAKSAAAVDDRINRRLAALDAAWNELQNATVALSLAEARLAAGVETQEGERISLAGPAIPAVPAVGGAQDGAARAVGGPSAASSPAVGGPMGSRRGGGRNAEYGDRMAALEADVKSARARKDAAQLAYNQLY